MPQKWICYKVILKNKKLIAGNQGTGFQGAGISYSYSIS